MNPLDARRLDVLVALHERTTLDLPDVLVAADWVLRGGAPEAAAPTQPPGDSRCGNCGHWSAQHRVDPSECSAAGCPCGGFKAES